MQRSFNVFDGSSTDHADGAYGHLFRSAQSVGIWGHLWFSPDEGPVTKSLRQRHEAPEQHSENASRPMCDPPFVARTSVRSALGLSPHQTETLLRACYKRATSYEMPYEGLVASNRTRVALMEVQRNFEILDVSSTEALELIEDG